jgi:hypothetical protein
MTGLDVRSITDHSLLYCELHIRPSLSSLDTSLASKTEFIKYDVKMFFAVLTKLSTELLKRLIVLNLMKYRNSTYIKRMLIFVVLSVKK